MSWLLFLDESGQDHQSLPYEVRGGIALHSSQVWPFVQEIQRLELATFGTMLHQYRTEIKGKKLLDKDRIRWANQNQLMPDEERRKHCRGFLTKGLEKKKPSRDEFTAYGQACLEMAVGIFEILRNRKARLFASVIPADIQKPKIRLIDETRQIEEYLRKDHVFLFERYFNFLEAEKEYGLLVMDEVEKQADRHFTQCLQNYFTKTQTGRTRTAWIVPTPFFVSSDMTYPVQAADLAIYCINLGFRLPARGMDAPVRHEIAETFGPWLKQLQYAGEKYEDGDVFTLFGIVYVPDPYTARKK